MTIAEMAKENIKNYNQRRILENEKDRKIRLKKFVEENTELTTHISETILKNSLEGINSGFIDIEKFDIINNPKIEMTYDSRFMGLISWLKFNNIKFEFCKSIPINPYGDLKLYRINYEIPINQDDADVKFLNSLRGN